MSCQLIRHSSMRLQIVPIQGKRHFQLLFPNSVIHVMHGASDVLLCTHGVWILLKFCFICLVISSILFVNFFLVRVRKPSLISIVPDMH